jgi:pyruvate kinase
MTQNILRKTKIVATIGPASCEKQTMTDMLRNGVDVFRFNMKHNVPEWHRDHIAQLAACCENEKMRAGVLIDLQGPEVRVQQLPNGAAQQELRAGELVRFSSEGNEGIILDHNGVYTYLSSGQTVYADDGLLEFQLTQVTDTYAEAEVLIGGELHVRKTMNFPGVSFDFPALAKRDIGCLSVMANQQVDYIALSFVRSVEDIMALKEAMKKYSISAKIVAKIEHPDAVKNLSVIIQASDAVMVARGDLGIEYPMEEVPTLQKNIIAACRSAGKPVIIATQMLESMKNAVRPTRAEVSDVANAVYDRADAVMLSTETASGKYPVRAVKTMARIARQVDRVVTIPELESDELYEDQTAAVVSAAHQLMRHSFHGANDIDAFVLLTETGKTVQYLSRLRPSLPIIALSGNIETLKQLQLLWGVYPLLYDFSKQGRIDEPAILSTLCRQGVIKKGKRVVMIYGHLWGVPGNTSVVRIQQVIDTVS